MYTRFNRILRWYGEDQTNNPPADPPAPEVVTKEEHDAIMRSLQDKHARELQRIADLESKLKGSEEERAKALSEIEEFRKRNMTAEELAKEEIRRREEGMAKQLEELQSSASQWESRFKQSQIEAAITRASEKHKAINSDQMLALLSSKAKVSELRDSEGNLSGKYEVVIPMMSDGNEIEPNVDKYFETIKKDEAYWNLFQTERKGGFETGRPQGSPQVIRGAAEFAKMYDKGPNNEDL